MSASDLIEHTFERVGLKFKVQMKCVGDVYEVSSFVHHPNPWRSTRIDWFLDKKDLMGVVHADWKVKDLLTEKTLFVILDGYMEMDFRLRGLEK